jgi:hypothetical protein
VFWFVVAIGLVIERATVMAGWGISGIPVAAFAMAGVNDRRWFGKTYHAAVITKK